MPNSNHTFTVVASLDDLAKALFVRGCVFVEELGIPYREEFDGGDESAMHFLGFASEEPVAAARLHHLDGAARIERICVRKAYRQKGLGDKLLSFVLATAEQAGYKRCSILADGMLVQWYRHHGFEILRKIERADGSECLEMLLTLGKKSVDQKPARRAKEAKPHKPLLTATSKKPQPKTKS
ncbi:GNAT family N-acetyltransferase, partial [Oligoflexia bacterium]|nr:GNAT family N-acetyltransferase [Oligoflexia bacterium]